MQNNCSVKFCKDYRKTPRCLSVHFSQFLNFFMGQLRTAVPEFTHFTIEMTAMELPYKAQSHIRVIWSRADLLFAPNRYTEPGPE